MSKRQVTRLFGNFSGADVRKRGALSSQKVDTRGFNDGKLHVVSVGKARFEFIKASQRLVDLLRGEGRLASVWRFADTTGQRFTLDRDGDVAVEPHSKNKKPWWRRAKPTAKSDSDAHSEFAETQVLPEREP